MNEIAKVLDKVREKQPLVHNITNQVVMNFTANGLYALGASPVMANAIEEAADMARNADALLLNIGTLTSDQVDAMVLAGKAANKKGIPVVFDPVGVGATPFRDQVAERILTEVKIALIRGNAGEISQLAGLEAEVRGVDSTGTADNKIIAKHAVKKLGVPIMVTGAEDVITDGEHLYSVLNGTPLLTKVTGTGCLLGAVTAAFLAVEGEVVEAATAAVAFYGVAAELAAETATKPGSFQVAFLDALSETTTQQVIEKSKLQTSSLSEG